MTILLRLTQTTAENNKYHVEIAVEEYNQPRSIANSQFQFALSSQEQENIRWYLEDFLQYNLQLEADRGHKIQQQMTEIGARLFNNIFSSNDNVKNLWSHLQSNLNNVRIEIVTQICEAITIPWELIFDPKTKSHLALKTRAFVRTHPTAIQNPKITQSSDSIRILLVTCRTTKETHQSYGLIQTEISKKLDNSTFGVFQLDMLNPPTFKELGRVLRKANNENHPYHIVHFDGHGQYTETIQSATSSEQIYKVKPLFPSELRIGSHGYLLFENPKIPENVQFVDGTALGSLLVETNVRFLILNACRSAHAQPIQTNNQEENKTTKAFLALDSHAHVQAFGTLAQEVMNAGVTGVVAMRYNVYIDTAVQFMADLYEALTEGLTLGEAATQARKQLKEQPLRKIDSEFYPLEDWSVPIVYEAVPYSLFPRSNRVNIEVENILQKAAKALNTEMDAVGLTKPNEVIQITKNRFKYLPTIFEEGLCKGRPLKIEKNQYFVSHSFNVETLADWRETLTESLANLNNSQESFQPYFSNDHLLGGFRLCGIVEKIYTTRFSIFLLPPSQDRNVYLELGIAIGLGIPFFLIQHYKAQIPPILEGLNRYVKGGLFRKMRRELANQIEEYDFGVVRFISDLSKSNSKTHYLIAAGEVIEDEDFEGSVKDAIEETGSKLEPLSLTEQLDRSGSVWALEQLVEAIQKSHFAIYRVDRNCSHTTFLALGVSIGLGRPFLMVQKENGEIPINLQGMGIYKFPNFITLSQKIIDKHKGFFQKYL
jgi:hypothetical protein